MLILNMPLQHHSICSFLHYMLVQACHLRFNPWWSKPAAAEAAAGNNVRFSQAQRFHPIQSIRSFQAWTPV